jgi:hypothetical protein
MNAESPEKIWGFFYFQSSVGRLLLDFPLLGNDLEFFSIFRKTGLKKSQLFDKN